MSHSSSGSREQAPSSGGGAGSVACCGARRSPHLIRGAVAGAAAGVVASWMMNVFFAGASKAKQAVEDPEQRAREQLEQAAAGDDATQKVADAVAVGLADRHLSKAEKQVVGPLVHYGFGGLMGGLYGAIAEVMPASRIGVGTLFGSALFLGADEVMVPLLGLGQPATEEPAASMATHWVGHLVYGATVELLRRGIRRVV
jgi:putative membrane protein